jgi:hypothetical protein
MKEDRQIQNWNCSLRQEVRELLQMFFHHSYFHTITNLFFTVTRGIVVLEHDHHLQW